jgi:CHASE2 domain-containing sensor protein
LLESNRSLLQPTNDNQATSRSSPHHPCTALPGRTQQAQAQSQAILKFLPFMVGYFSLNVPSGLGVYWIANNLITTLTTCVRRASLALTYIVLLLFVLSACVSLMLVCFCSSLILIRVYSPNTQKHNNTPASLCASW